jgi:hypothetical protein
MSAVDVGIGAAGIVGVALETTEGTYLAPQKFIPVRSESLNWVQETVWRRPIRGVADVVGAAEGNARVEGDIEFEVFTDVLPYFLYAARGTITKTDTVGVAPFTYTFKPSHAATPTKTMSVYVERHGEVFAYLGCVIGSMSFTVDEGILVCTMSVLGRDENTQTASVAAYNEEDFIGAGMYDIRVPAAAVAADLTIDTFTLEMQNNPEPQYRLNPTSAGARYISYGEREVTLELERDFNSRAELAEFKALTSKAISIRAARSASRYVDFQMRAAIVDSYEVNLSGQGDLVRAGISYQGIYSETDTESLQIEVMTGEDIIV